MSETYVVEMSAPCKNCSQDHGVMTFKCRPILFDDPKMFHLSKMRAPTANEKERGITWKEVQNA